MLKNYLFATAVFLDPTPNNIYNKRYDTVEHNQPCHRSRVKTAFRNKHRVCRLSKTATAQCCQQTAGTKSSLGCEMSAADSRHPSRGAQCTEPSLQTASCPARHSNHNNISMHSHMYYKIVVIIIVTVICITQPSAV